MSSNKKKTIRRTKAASQRANLPLIRSPRDIRASPAVHQLCGLLDPFCRHAEGSKYPNSSAAKTFPFTKRTLYTLSGVDTIIHYPQLNKLPYALPKTYVPPNITEWDDFGFDDTFVGASWRIVSAGFIVRNTASPDTSSGLVSIRQWDMESRPYYSTLNPVTYNCANSFDIPLQDCREVAVVSMKSSKFQGAFNDAATLNIATAGTQVNAVLPTSVTIKGGPLVGATLSIEFITHYELIFDDGNSLGAMATSPNTSIEVGNMAGQISSTMVTIVKDGAVKLGTLVVNAAVDAIQRRLGGTALLALTM